MSVWNREPGLEPPRRVLHVDMDAFFVSVELLKRPDLCGQPVIVGGRGARGVVSTCSYEARKFGIHSAMPSVRAIRLCPEAVWLPGDHKAYSYYSHRVFDIMRQYSPEVIQLSIDEGRMDLTGSESLFGPAEQIADRILVEIRETLNLPASAGLANSGTVAKIAAEIGKPNGLTVILPGYEARFLAPLNLQRIPGIGPKSLPHFHRQGFHTIGDLAACSRDELERRIGSWAGRLHDIATGRSRRVTRHQAASPSRGHEETFREDIQDRDVLRVELRKLVEKLGFRLRKEGVKARTVTVKIRDGRFNTVTRSRTVSHAANTDDILFQAAWELLIGNLPAGGVRLIGVSAHNLCSGMQQMDLFGAGDRKKETFYQTVDTIKNRFGKQSARFGRSQSAAVPGSRQ